MTDGDAPTLRIERILRTLHEHGVEYVLVGGIASALHGATRATSDVDLCPAWDRANLTRLANALQRLAAVEKGTGMAPDPHGLHNREITNWRTPFGDVDVLLGIPEKSLYERAQYRKLAEDALAIEVADGTVLVASLAAIIRSKELADREKDREALAELRALEAAQNPPG